MRLKLERNCGSKTKKLSISFSLYDKHLELQSWKNIQIKNFIIENACIAAELIRVETCVSNKISKSIFNLQIL